MALQAHLVSASPPKVPILGFLASRVAVFQFAREPEKLKKSKIYKVVEFCTHKNTMFIPFFLIIYAKVIIRGSYKRIGHYLIVCRKAHFREKCVRSLLFPCITYGTCSSSANHTSKNTPRIDLKLWKYMLRMYYLRLGLKKLSFFRT